MKCGLQLLNTMPHELLYIWMTLISIIKEKVSDYNWILWGPCQCGGSRQAKCPLHHQSELISISHHLSMSEMLTGRSLHWQAGSVRPDSKQLHLNKHQHFCDLTWKLKHGGKKRLQSSELPEAHWLPTLIKYLWMVLQWEKTRKTRNHIWGLCGGM